MNALHPFHDWGVRSPYRKPEPSEEMTKVTVDLPEECADLIERRATALGTTAGQWLSLVIADVVADAPDEGDGPDGWICR